MPATISDLLTLRGFKEAAFARSIGIPASTLYSITRVSRLRKVNIISNPTLGLTTTPDEVVEGNEKLKKILEGGDVGIDYVCVLSELYDEVKDRIEEPLIPIDIFIIYPWLFRNPGKIIPEGPRGLSMR